MTQLVKSFTFAVYPTEGGRHSIHSSGLEEERIEKPHGWRYLTWLTVPNNVPSLPSGEVLVYFESPPEYWVNPQMEASALHTILVRLLVVFTHGAVTGWRVIDRRTQPRTDYEYEVALHKWAGDRSLPQLTDLLVPSKSQLRQFCKADLLAFYVHHYEQNGPLDYIPLNDIPQPEFCRFPYADDLVRSVHKELCLEEFFGGHQQALALTPETKDDASDEVAESIEEMQSGLQGIGRREGWLAVPEPKSVLPAEAPRVPTPDPRIFVIHGHDEAKQRELVHILEQRLHLDVVVMREHAGKSRTFIEKFEQVAEPCNAAIAIITPDDKVQARDGAYRQPRPNVVYELGWFAGRCGRERTLLLVKDGATVPSDWLGIEQLRFRENIEEVYLKLEREINEWRKTPEQPTAPADRGPGTRDVAQPSPGGDQAGDSPTLVQHLREPLEILWRALSYAKQQGGDLWEFAVEISDLEKAGATKTDLRWLVSNKYLEHAERLVRSPVNGRAFRYPGRTTIRDTSCFVLTEKGANWAQSTFGLKPMT